MTPLSEVLARIRRTLPEPHRTQVIRQVMTAQAIQGPEQAVEMANAWLAEIQRRQA